MLTTGRCHARSSRCSSALTRSSATVPDGSLRVAGASRGLIGESDEWDDVESKIDDSLLEDLRSGLEKDMEEGERWALATRSRMCAG